MIRTFISLQIPEPVFDKVLDVAKKELGSQFYKYRWTKKENFHITLKFIGEIEEEKVEKIIDNLSFQTSEFDKLTLQFSKFSFFKKNGRPAIFWIGCEYNGLLLNIVNHIENSLLSLGFPKEEKNFKTHLTLLRLKGDEDIEPLNKLNDLHFEEIFFKPENISLMKSELSAKGSKYFVIKNLVI